MHPPPIPYRPFLSPIDLHAHWYLALIPMAILIAIIYKAVRMRSLDGYARAVVIMSAQIIGGMIALGVASYLLVNLFAHWVATWSAGG